MALKNINNLNDIQKEKINEINNKFDIERMMRYEREFAYESGLRDAKTYQNNPYLLTNSSNSLGGGMYPGSTYFPSGGSMNFTDVRFDRTGINSIQTLAAMIDSDLLTRYRHILTFLYAYNGLIKNTIDTPVEDAFRHGIKIKVTSSVLDDVAFDTDDFMNYLEDTHIIRTIKEAMIYSRLYGGSALIILTNDSMPYEPLDIRRFSKETNIKFLPVDRWELSWYGDPDFQYRPKRYEHRQFIEKNNFYDPTYYIYRHNVLHKSRVIRILPQRPPNMLLELLQGWGLSVIEGAKKSLNAYIKTCESIYAMVDESRIDIYKFENYADNNLTFNGMNAISSRMRMQHQFKNLTTAIVLDKEDEYDQKHMSFTGLADIMAQQRINISSDSGIPVQKQWKVESMPFTSGEASIDDYNNFIDSILRPKASEILRRVLPFLFKKHVGITPAYKLEFYPLKSQTAMEEETIKQSKQNRFIAGYANNSMTYEQFMNAINEAGLNRN